MSKSISLFEPARLPARDDNGYVDHPDLPDFDDGETWHPKIAALGFDGQVVTMTATESECFAALESPDVSWWRPEGAAGWWLASIFPTEDGAAALYVRPQQGWRVLWDRHDDATANLLNRVGFAATASEVATWPDNRVRDAEGWAAGLLMALEGYPGAVVPPRPHWLHNLTTVDA